MTELPPDSKNIDDPDRTSALVFEPEVEGSHTPDDIANGTLIAGKYRLLEAIGEGGMGAVWLAEQFEPVKRQVAIKLIRAGMDSKTILARFEAERQALSMMDHPNIARVLDAGALSNGRPYFVMELVKGTPITDFCDQRKLTPRQRLELFVPVCLAIQHAHQKGIIHRDIKPSNVLVALHDDKPVPKVIDFGVAKATGFTLTEKTLHTGFEQVVGTPAYMSPEQATFNQLDIDTRSDVYSLGVLLYELLAGSPPLSRSELQKKGLLEVLRAVREEDPPKPSTKLSTANALPSLAANRGTEPRKLTGLLRNELDWVVMKALEKDRTRRYETANSFAADVQRYLDGEPVTAHPPSTAYRLSKFVRRNKTQVIAASLVFLAVAVGMAVSFAKYREAERQRHIAQDREIDADRQRVIADGRAVEARQEAAKANAARDFLVSIFKLAETNTKGGNVTVREVLDVAESRIPNEFANQPELRAGLVASISDVKRSIARRIPQSMLLEVHGTVGLHSATGVKKPVAPQTLLYLDDTLTLGSDARVKLVCLSDLHQEEIKPGRTVVVESRGCEPADAVRSRSEDLLMTFVPLPKGVFYMGWDGRSKGVRTEITEPFEIAVHPVTQGQWMAVMGSNPSFHSRKSRGSSTVLDISDEELKLFPVESVTWDEAATFLSKLNQLEKGRGWVYRLPTTTEWEYACRGGASTEAECSYHFYLDKPSNTLMPNQANYNTRISTGPSAKGPYLQRTSRVGAYSPNKLGLCDMHGNVFEFVTPGPGEGNRMLRGGAWNQPPAACQAGLKIFGSKTDRSFDRGLRLVRTRVQ